MRWSSSSLDTQQLWSQHGIHRTHLFNTYLISWFFGELYATDVIYWVMWLWILYIPKHISTSLTLFWMFHSIFLLYRFYAKFLTFIHKIITMQLYNYYKYLNFLFSGLFCSLQMRCTDLKFNFFNSHKRLYFSKSMHKQHSLVRRHQFFPICVSWFVCCHSELLTTSTRILKEWLKK